MLYMDRTRYMILNVLHFCLILNWSVVFVSGCTQYILRCLPQNDLHFCLQSGNTNLSIKKKIANQMTCISMINQKHKKHSTLSLTSPVWLIKCYYRNRNYNYVCSTKFWVVVEVNCLRICDIIVFEYVSHHMTGIRHDNRVAILPDSVIYSDDLTSSG